MSKILSIDFGLRRVGLAIADSRDSIAFSTEPIKYKNYLNLINILQQFINKEKYSIIVIGIPLGYEQKETQMSLQVRAFAEDIKKDIIQEVKIEFWNEVLTSKMAHFNLRKSRNKSSIDSESARIILQEYLDYQIEKNGKQNY